jgi:hypothetical protein
VLEQQPNWSGAAEHVGMRHREENLAASRPTFSGILVVPAKPV